MITMPPLLQKALVFAVTFLAFMGQRFIKEGWAFSKRQLQRDLPISTHMLGWIDAVLVLSSAVGMAVLGSQLHRLPLTLYVAAGLTASSLFYMLSPLVYSLAGWFSPAFLTASMALCGFFLAPIWPGCMGIMSNWFSQSKKGALMVLWSMSSNLGNIVALNLCNVLERQGTSWKWNYFMTGLMSLFAALLIAVAIKQTPQNSQSTSESVISHEQSDDPLQSQEQPLSQDAAESGDRSVFRYGIFSALALPRVPYYVVGMVCLKSSVYGLIFWLPSYLDDKGGAVKAQKGFISAMQDVGTLVAGVFFGHLSDLLNKRALFLSPLMFVCAGLMFTISFAMQQASAWEYYLALFFIGVTEGTPFSLLSTVAVIDLGTLTREKGSVSKVSSLIEGVGSFFSAIQMIVIPYVPFEDIFYLFSSEMLVGGLALLPLLVRDLRDMLSDRKKQSLLEQESQQ